MNLSGNLKFLRKKAGKTQDGLSADVSIGRTTIANYEAGISEPNLETLMVFANYFGISVDVLLSRNLDKEGLPDTSAAMSVVPHSGNIPYNKVPQVISVDRNGNDNIIYVPVKARAGYLLGYGDPEFMETLPTFRLPGLSNATFRMFEVDGPSMAPNIMHADRIIGEWIEGFDKIRDNRVHVIVHKGGVAVKRILNRIEERGKLYLKSDTIAHRHEFPTVEIDPEDVKEIWYGRLKISGDFSEPAEVYHRLADLEVDVMEMKRFMKGK
ncbi:MAG: LexA family transcriptional regulator [Flavipsychrobacter sp.]|nr:LexA family transcriptional regulator [Flavipsychrobacter sp.]